MLFWFPQEYPEYYEVIKKPIDFNKISQKIQQGTYESMEAMLIDVTHMFDNAMMFNESESILYKVRIYHLYVLFDLMDQ